MRIVFLSCLDAVRVGEQPVWDAVAALDPAPDLLMLLGDQIYMDWAFSVWFRRWQHKVIHPGGLEDYARDMHRRYAAQWAVPGFRKVVRELVRHKGPDRLLMCWDDHDFAWNNALGGVTSGKGFVPPAVQSISRRLFDQFGAVLRNPDWPDDYPAFDLKYAMESPVPSGGIEYFAPQAVDGVLWGVMDQRSYRRERPAPGDASTEPLLLGQAQMNRLKEVLARRAPLTVLGGGVPLSARYFMGSLLGGEDWEGRFNQRPAYPDLALFLDAAQSPVLYLGGDIHRNLWGGLIRKADGSASRVVHAVSSGASRGWQGPLWVEPAFGVVDAQVQPDGTGRVGVCLNTLGQDGQRRGRVLPLLRFTREGWDSGNIPPHDDE